MSPTNIDVNGIITAVLPSVLDLIRGRHAAVNPGAPPLTDEQVKDGLRSAIATSLAQDDADEADIRRRNPPASGGATTTATGNDTGE